MLSLENHFTGTYAKIILADWQTLTNYIRKETTWIKDTLHSSDGKNKLMPDMLTDLQINDALNGPLQSFFKSHLHAFAVIKKMETALTISKEDSFKESEHINEKIFSVPDRLLAKTEFSTLISLRAKLDEKTKTHYEQWETQIQNWANELLAIFEKNNFVLSDLEKQDFLNNQPNTELNDRFINLKITLPKLSGDYFDFQQYFTLKSELAIHSALNRMHEPRTEKDIEKTLKTMRPALKEIGKTEKKLSETQKKDLVALVVDISF